MWIAPWKIMRVRLKVIQMWFYDLIQYLYSNKVQVKIQKEPWDKWLVFKIVRTIHFRVKKNTQVIKLKVHIDWKNLLLNCKIVVLKRVNLLTPRYLNNLSKIIKNYKTW